MEIYSLIAIGVANLVIMGVLTFNHSVTRRALMVMVARHELLKKCFLDIEEPLLACLSGVEKLEQLSSPVDSQKGR